MFKRNIKRYVCLNDKKREEPFPFLLFLANSQLERARKKERR